MDRTTRSNLTVSFDSDTIPLTGFCIYLKILQLLDKNLNLSFSELPPLNLFLYRSDRERRGIRTNVPQHYCYRAMTGGLLNKSSSVTDSKEQYNATQIQRN